ncbi:MAG: hypothetical protein RMJ98_16590, partial [Myxococcales bacterium]|nr:hypothetical protein [Myxococcales bacterium]
STSGALPTGHPPVGELPPGHPTLSSHGEPGGGRLRMPLQSRAQEDPAVAAGTIEVEVRDGEGNPLPGRDVFLGIVENSVAKGESRQKKVGRSDEHGKVSFSGLDTGSTFAYRVSMVRDGATYAAPPFNFPQTGGMRVTLFAYPVTTEVSRASIASQGIAYLELRDEVIQIEIAYRIYNLGSITWLATDVQVPLPPGFKAFNSQKGMSDLGWDGTLQGTRLRGTLAPGVHETAFRFQIPYPDEGEVHLDLGLLPHVQAFRVLSDAPRGMTLDVDGFPQAISSTHGNGQRVLVTEKELPRLDPNFRRVRIHLMGMPTRPQGRWYAVALALAALVLGLIYAARSKQERLHSDEELKQAKERLLDELEQLEQDKAAGEVGPRTYEAARRTMLDALARLIQAGDERTSRPRG